MTDLEKHVNQPGRDKLVKQVREKMIKVLEGFDFPIKNLYLSASKNSVGKQLTFKNKN